MTYIKKSLLVLRNCKKHTKLYRLKLGYRLDFPFIQIHKVLVSTKLNISTATVLDC